MMDRYQDPVNDYSAEVEKEDCLNNLRKECVDTLVSGEDCEFDNGDYKTTIDFDVVVCDALEELESEDYAQLILSLANGEKDAQERMKKLIRDEAIKTVEIQTR